MARQPESDPQTLQLAERLKDPTSGWLGLVLESLAGAVLKAARWQLWEEGGGTPGPGDSPGSWPRLPDGPGERVLLGVLDIGTAEGREAAREAVEALRGLEWGKVDPVAELATTIREDLGRSPKLLGEDFYLRAARRVVRLLGQKRKLPVVVMAGRRHNLWQHPEHSPGLLPADHPLAPPEELEEAAALQVVAWEAARHLYRAVGEHLLPAEAADPQRMGLEHPTILRNYAERWGLMPLPPAEPPLLDGQDALDVATDKRVRNGVALVLSPKLEEDELGAVCRRPDTDHRLVEVGFDPHSNEPAAFASLKEVQQVLKEHGSEMGLLCMHLCGYVCELGDPTRRFWLKGTELLESLGYDFGGRHAGQTRAQRRSALLHKLATTAFQLERVWATTRPGTENAPRYVQSGRLWTIGLESELAPQLELELELGQEPLWQELTLSVVAGNWVDRYRRGGAEGAGGWYTPIASNTLKLSRFGNDLAVRMGVFLALVGRERALATAKAPGRDGSWTCALERLLVDVLPPWELAEAKAPGRAGSVAADRLRRTLDVALGILQKEVGYRFTFGDSYPLWARPSWARPEDYVPPPKAPNGAFGLQLRGELTIHWPEPVIQRNGREQLERKLLGEAETTRRRLRAASRRRNSGAAPHELAEALKVAVDALPIPQKRVAEALGIHPTLLSKYLRPGTASGRKLKPEQLKEYLERLRSLKHLQP